MAYIYLGQLTRLTRCRVGVTAASPNLRPYTWLLQRSKEKLIYQLCYVFLF
jgi:hypothetical protein